MCCNHTCVSGDCCTDSDCAAGEDCVDNECVAGSCVGACHLNLECLELLVAAGGLDTWYQFNTYNMYEWDIISSVFHYGTTNTECGAIGNQTACGGCPTECDCLTDYAISDFEFQVTLSSGDYYILIGTPPFYDTGSTYCSFTESQYQALIDNAVANDVDYSADNFKCPDNTCNCFTFSPNTCQRQCTVSNMDLPVLVHIESADNKKRH